MGIGWWKRECKQFLASLSRMGFCTVKISQSHIQTDWKVWSDIGRKSSYKSNRTRSCMCHKSCGYRLDTFQPFDCISGRMCSMLLNCWFGRFSDSKLFKAVILLCIGNILSFYTLGTQVTFVLEFLHAMFPYILGKFGWKGLHPSIAFLQFTRFSTACHLARWIRYWVAP